MTSPETPDGSAYSADQLQVDPQLIGVLRGIGASVLSPAVERDFSDDTDRLHRELTEVILPKTSLIHPGETIEQAHLRLQATARRQK